MSLPTQDETVSVPQSFLGRVGHLENQVGGIATQLSSYAATQDAMGDKLEDVADSVAKIADHLNAPKPQTQWWALIGGVIAIVGTINLFATQALNNAKELTAVHVRYLNKQGTSQGARLEGLDARIRVVESSAEASMASHQVMRDYIKALGGRS